jgi:hypothetical protein
MNAKVNGGMIMTTVLCDLSETVCSSGHVDNDDLWVSAEEFTAATGWSLKPEGFCKGEICVAATSPKTAPLVRDNRINVSGLWHHLGHPVVHDEASKVWVLGASARDRASALQSTEAPDFSLPDLAGKMHSLSESRGKKVLLATWASW